MNGNLEPEENVWGASDVDAVIDYDKHLSNGDVYRVTIRLPLSNEDNEVLHYTVGVDLIATSSELARYIASTMYPEYDSISVSHEVHSSSR